MTGTLLALYAGELQAEHPTRPPTANEVERFLAIFWQRLGPLATADDIRTEITSATARIRRAFDEALNVFDDAQRAVLHAVARHPSQVDLASTPATSVEQIFVEGRLVLIFVIDRLPPGHGIHALPPGCRHSSAELTAGAAVVALATDRCPMFASIASFEAGAILLDSRAAEIAAERRDSVRRHLERQAEFHEATKTPMAIMRERLAALESKLATNNASGGTS